VPVITLNEQWLIATGMFSEENDVMSRSLSPLHMLERY